MSESTHNFPFYFIYPCVFVLLHLSAMRYENVILFSVLHVAVMHRKQQLVNDLLDLVKKLPPTKPQLVDCIARNGYVSNVHRSMYMYKVLNVLQ